MKQMMHTMDGYQETGEGGETENKRRWLNREKKPQKIHFMDHQWIFRVGEWTTSNVCMIPRYFAIEARCIKINNGKYEFKIMYQQATSGLHYPPQTNQQISRYQQEMQRSNKNPNQTRNQLHSYLREPFSGKALFSCKRLKSSSNVD